MTFGGITFPEQKVSPSADAMLMKAILGDGILHGCDLDYAGFTLTVAAGQLVISGRSISHPASESLAISGATSGFARVVISIDLSKTSTVDVFEQVDAYVEYATTTDGFPVLEQSEINVSGIKYQVELCVVSLSTGGITGVVRKLPGATLRAAPELLANLFAAGYTRLSSYQIVEELPDPANLPDGTCVGLLIQEV